MALHDIVSPLPGTFTAVRRPTRTTTSPSTRP
jgi:hypothetical protein